MAEFNGNPDEVAFLSAAVPTDAPNELSVAWQLLDSGDPLQSRFNDRIESQGQVIGARTIRAFENDKGRVALDQVGKVYLTLHAGDSHTSEATWGRDAVVLDFGKP